MTDNGTRIDLTLTQASASLAAVSESPRLDAELLLSQALDVARSYLFAHPEDMLDDVTTERFQALLDRRQSGEPLAYLQGTKEFWSLPLMVSSATLVPRPETEILVQQALDAIPRDAECTVLDLGTGSGAIALAIAKERPDAAVTATDTSESAIAVARENARQLDIANVNFATGSWFAAVPGHVFDLIVSNPPYVRRDDPALDRLTFEPRSALVSGIEGLDDIQVIVREGISAIRPGGRLMLEHGADQAEKVAQLMAAAGWSDVECRPDYAGLPRVTSARR